MSQPIFLFGRTSPAAEVEGLGHTRGRHRTARTLGGAIAGVAGRRLGGRRCLRLSTLSSHGCLPDVAEVTIFHPINAGPTGGGAACA